jgi:hypothetical protein
MVNALGICQHNNVGTYCPSCARLKAMSGMRGMGACSAGYSSDNVLGICLPSLSSIATGAQAEGAALLAQGVATTPSIQAAAANAASQGVVTNIVNAIKAHPYMYGGGAVAALLLLTYGGMTFIRGK